MKRLHRETANPGKWRVLKEASRRMRVDPTPEEDALWQQLRASALGSKFRRQHAIGDFVVDFVCLRARLIIEVDGETHETMKARDATRDAILTGLGYRVLHITNKRVHHDLQTIMKEIQEALTSPLPGSGSP